MICGLKKQLLSQYRHGKNCLKRDVRTFTQRRSAAKSVGCFQRRLFNVCLCVFVFVNTITSERVNIADET